MRSPTRRRSAAWCWGSNTAGQLGNGTKKDSLVPVQAGIGHDWLMLSVGNDHTCGVRTDHTAWGWGSAGRDTGTGFGKLGDGTGSDSSIPVQVIG